MYTIRIPKFILLVFFSYCEGSCITNCIPSCCISTLRYGCFIFDSRCLFVISRDFVCSLMGKFSITTKICTIFDIQEHNPKISALLLLSLSLSLSLYLL